MVGGKILKGNGGMFVRREREREREGGKGRNEGLCYGEGIEVINWGYGRGEGRR